MGKEVLAEVTETSIDDPSLPRLYEKVYEKFIEEIDAIDNGIDQYDGTPRFDNCFFYFQQPENVAISNTLDYDLQLTIPMDLSETCYHFRTST